MSRAIHRARQMVEEEENPDEIGWYMPSPFFFRSAMREENDLECLRELALRAVLELENFREWCEDYTGVPSPKKYVLSTEAEVKQMKLINPDVPNSFPVRWHPVCRY